MIDSTEVIYLALCDTVEESGWGTCSRYMDKELSKRTNVVNLQKRKALHSIEKIPGTILHAIANCEFEKIIPVHGYFDAGYCFFENYLTERAIETARQYDLILTGSSYNTEILKSYGLRSVETLIQGIDPDIFNPIKQPKDRWKDYFVIFSGGKMEFRKGQDLVLAAVKIIQERHKDVFFINCWENVWSHSFETLSASPHIKFKNHGDTWVEKMAALYALNHMYMGRCMSYPLVPQRELRNIIKNSDLGVFVSRCEGGTNLAMMEYMACGKPVVATMTSGHQDILTDSNCFQVKKLAPNEFKANGVPIALWDDPDLEEIVACIEEAYNNRGRARDIGANGAKDMRRLTWERTAKQALSSINASKASVPQAFKPQNRNEFGQYLNEIGLLGAGVEVGVQRGEFSEILRKSWEGNILHLVDRWKASEKYDDIANVSQEEHDDNFHITRERFSADPSVNIIKLDSLAAASLFEDGHFSFIYLDGDHSYEGCKADIAAWWPKLKKGGVMAGHDFLDGYVKEVGQFGVKSAVEEFAAANNLHFGLTKEESWVSWFCAKK